jgi:hypothetical protein
MGRSSGVFQQQKGIIREARDWDNVQSFSYRSCMHDAGYLDLARSSWRSSRPQECASPVSPGAMPTSGRHRLTAGVKEYKDDNRLHEFI